MRNIILLLVVIFASCNNTPQSPERIIKYDQVVEFADSLEDGEVLQNDTIIGTSGRVYNQTGGKYFGAVYVKKTAIIRNMTFKNCDKWAIKVQGDRSTLFDTTYIINCAFDSIAAEGYGYGVWNQYGTVIIDSCKFNFLRHAFDCGSEGNVTVIKNSTFRNCFYIPIHQHRYIGDSVGMGLTVKNCYFYDTYMPLDIGVPFKGVNVIDSNYFLGNWIGKMGRDTIPVGTNFMNGKGMKPAPEITTSKTNYRVGEKMTLKIGSSGYWNNGVSNRQTTTTFNFPMVRVYSAHTGGIADTITVLCSDTGTYTSLRVLANCDFDFYNGDKLVQSVKKGKALDYKFYYFKADVHIRVKGTLIGVDRATFNVSDGYRALRVRTSAGAIHIDNLCKNTYYDTYEFSLKTKVRQVGEWLEVGR